MPIAWTKAADVSVEGRMGSRGVQGGGATGLGGWLGVELRGKAVVRVDQGRDTTEALRISWGPCFIFQRD